jgi:hypothetical protein
MSLLLQLILGLAATLAALGGVIWSGITHRRAVHYRFITLFAVCLAFAIWRAEAYGRGLVFEGASATVRTVHMGAVAATFASLAFVLWTGVRLARGTRPAEGAHAAAGPSAAGTTAGAAPASPRRAHHRASEIFVGLVLITSALGTAMTVLASRP